MDINKVWLSGIAVTQPVLTKLPANNTPFTTFTMQVNESFVDKSGAERIKANFIMIESLGKNAEATVSKVSKGQRYMVDGYIRTDKRRDNEEIIKIRTFTVYRDRTAGAAVYSEGLREALGILKKSLNKEAAISALESLLAAP